MTMAPRYDSTSLHNAAALRRSYSIGQVFLYLWDQFGLWQERARSRHVLSLMDEAALKDIGLSRSLAESEINKPFWRS
jgi:uncharacterized protein YjiS (DUF1127 family)